MYAVCVCLDRDQRRWWHATGEGEIRRGGRWPAGRRPPGGRTHHRRLIHQPRHRVHGRPAAADSGYMSRCKRNIRTDKFGKGNKQKF